MVGKSSAEAAAGDLAEYFHYGFVTGHRPENITEPQLSDFLCGITRPVLDCQAGRSLCLLLRPLQTLGDSRGRVAPSCSVGMLHSQIHISGKLPQRPRQRADLNA